MWILSIIGLLLAAFLLRRKYKLDFYIALPFSLALMILIMYVLAFFSALKYIDLLAAVEIIAFGIYLKKSSKIQKTEIRSEFLEFLKLPQLWSVIIISISITILTFGQFVSWWDDLNYWATDAKALYYTNGFAGKYGNVAPEFGDYPPAVQLMKWWFLHFATTYTEGLQFAGYYFMNFVFLLPVIKELRSKNILIHILGCTILSFIPSMVDQFWAYGTCADVTMGILYGAALLEFYRASKDEKEDNAYRNIYIAAILSVLILVKTVAIEWVVFAILFGVILKTLTLYPFKKNSIGKGVSILVIAAPAIIEISWMLFCLINRRVAKLTSAGVKMAASGNYTLPGDAKERLTAYLQGFWQYAMHGNNSIFLDLSAGALLIVIIVILAGLSALKFLEKKEFHKMLLFALLTAFAAYGIILIGHLTIFQTENQYLEASVMAKSIERYGAPFSIGFIMLLAGIVLSYKGVKNYLVKIALAATVLLTVDYSAIAYAYGGYYAEREQALTDRQSMIGEVESTFLNTISGKTQLYGNRVIFIQDATEIHWIRNTYTNFYASPIPVVYASLYAEELTAEAILNQISTLHGSYIYIQEMDADIGTILQQYMLDGDEFQYNKVYEIVEDNGETYFRII